MVLTYNVDKIELLANGYMGEHSAFSLTCNLLSNSQHCTYNTMGLHKYVSDPPCCDQTGKPLYHETREVSAADYLESYRQGEEPRRHETWEVRGGASREPPPDIRFDTSYLSSGDLGASATPTAHNNTHTERLCVKDSTTYETSGDLIKSLSYRESDVAKLIKFNGYRNQWQCQASDCKYFTAKKSDIEEHVKIAHLKIWARTCEFCGRRLKRWDMCCPSSVARKQLEPQWGNLWKT